MIKTAFNGDSPVGQLWNRIRELYLQRGGTEKELLREVDRGYSENIQTHPTTYNEQGVVETEEVFEFAYTHPEFYPLLAQQRLPIPFVFKDFSDDSIFDDQLSHELSRFDQQLAEQLAQRLPKDGEPYRRELARLIFGDSRKRFPKKPGTDCQIEATAAQAVWAGCGACTESTNQLYARYLHVGLQPRILFFHNWVPSLDWLDMITSNGVGMDHVWLAIPLLQGGLLQADLLHGEFDIQPPVKMEVTPRQYTVLWLSNRSANYLQQGKVDQALTDTQLLLKIAPKSANDRVEQLMLLRRLGQNNRAEAEYQRMKAELPNSPHLELADFIMNLESGDASPNGLEQQIGRYNEHLKKIDVTAPQLAAAVRYNKAREGVETITPLLPKMQGTAWEDIQRHEAISPDLRSMLVLIRTNYRESMRRNPNSPFAFLEYVKFMEAGKWYGEGADDFFQLLLAHPTHPPFAYAAAYFNLKKWESSKGKDKEALGEARLYLDLLTTKLEPQNPRSYTLLSDVLVAQGDPAAALETLRKGWSLWGRKGPPQLYAQAYFMAMVKNRATADELRKVVHQTFSNSPGVFIKELTRILDNQYSIRLAGPISVEALTREFSGEAARLQVLNDALAQYPGAWPNVDALRLIESLAFDLAGDESSAAVALTKVRDMGRPEVTRERRYLLTQMVEWLNSTDQFESETIRRVESFFKRLRAHADQDLVGLYARLDTLCAGRHAGLGQLQESKDAWQRALQLHSAMAVHTATDLIQDLSRWETLYNFVTMVDDVKGSYAPEFGRIVQKAFWNLAQQCRDRSGLCQPHQMQELNRRSVDSAQTSRQAGLRSD